MRDDSDESLMLRYRDGDVRAFEVLVTRHRKPVFNFILRFVRDTAQAEDVLAGDVPAGRQGRRRLRAAGEVHDLAVHHRAQPVRRRVAPRQASQGGLARRADRRRGRRGSLLDLVADGGAAVGSAGARAASWRVRLQQAIAALPDEQREIFFLREVADLQFNEIAEIVGCPENTVKSRMRYALEKLREALEEYRDLAQGVQ